MSFFQILCLRTFLVTLSKTKYFVLLEHQKMFIFGHAFNTMANVEHFYMAKSIDIIQAQLTI